MRRFCSRLPAAKRGFSRRKSPERSVDRDPDVLRAAVGAPDAAVAVRDLAELRRQDDIVAPAPDCAPDELLVRVRAVDLGRVEEVDAELERTLDRADRLGVV